MVITIKLVMLLLLLLLMMMMMMMMINGCNYLIKQIIA